MSREIELNSDERLNRLIEWAQQELHEHKFTVSVASADASFRRYFRLRADESSWIVMDAPPEKEDIGPFIRVAQMLEMAGVNAPKVLARNLEEGYLLLTDLGDRTYLMALSDSARVEALYGDALGALVRMQAGCVASAVQLPLYDAALLRREMELFPEWLLGRHLAIKLDSAAKQALEAAFTFLTESALAQPRAFVHRDYHSRNLMATENSKHGENPGILDFQDAVYGPVTYDLVSLLRDCYVAWPPDRVRRWALRYRDAAAAVGIDVGASEETFLRWFDLMGIQRHLKASGIFARLWHRDGKQGYLKDIPRTVEYIRQVGASYPELAGLVRLIESAVTPRLAK